jgi:hypothetical protein
LSWKFLTLGSKGGTKEKHSLITWTLVGYSNGKLRNGTVRVENGHVLKADRNSQINKLTNLKRSTIKWKFYENFTDNSHKFFI